MWKEYSLSYIKHNRSSGLSIVIAASISAMLLSLLCGLFFNMWKYEVERIELEEGGWQSRIEGKLDSSDIVSIQNFATVKEAAVNKEESTNGVTVVDIYFDNMRTVLEDTRKIVELMKASPITVTYHYELLAMYMIRAAQDTAPRLLLPMFILIMIMASFSLIVIIHNSFAVSMNARIHQFGIFSSIGATPKQIRTCLLQEAAALCVVPVFIGNLLGVLIGMGMIQMVNVLLGNGVEGRHKAVFSYHPLVLAVSLLITVLTIWISAWLPAIKLSKLAALEAIRNNGDLKLKCKKNSPILTLLFGITGELAGNALKAQRKALRTASISLVFSFMAFTLMQCFFTLTQISTRETYFERYQDVWDIIVTLKDTDVDSFGEIEDLQGLSEVRSVILYQKAMAKRVITEDELSEAMKSLGGFSHASNHYVRQAEEGWMVNAPIIILDDASFQEFCGQIGVIPRLDGAIIRNQIRDMTNPDFRHPKYMPYVKGESTTSILKQSGNEEITAEIPVLTYTDKAPGLREEYAGIDYYELVHFVPVSLWKQMKGQIAGGEENTYICILSEENATLEMLNTLQGEVSRNLSSTYTIESENRIQEQEANHNQIQGMMMIFGGFCVLLAMIGIGNVFSNTLGFVHQRKREFVRYMSVGMTPEEIRRMFYIEALVIAGRPILITIPISVFTIWYLLRLSYLEAGIFLAELPLFPIAFFVLLIWMTVALAYYLGWRSIRSIHLAEVLRDETMI